jgi:hypothetical protein
MRDEKVMTLETKTTWAAIAPSKSNFACMRLLCGKGSREWTGSRLITLRMDGLHADGATVDVI